MSHAISGRVLVKARVEWTWIVVAGPNAAIATPAKRPNGVGLVDILI
jgi:hypothetical protein